MPPPPIAESAAEEKDDIVGRRCLAGRSFMLLDSFIYYHTGRVVVYPMQDCCMHVIGIIIIYWNGPLPT